MRWIWLSAGHFFLLVGIIGILIPLLPTTPFLLLAAACYSRGSEKFENWLLNHPYLGASVRDWRSHRVIRRKVKALAIVSLFFALSFPMYFVSSPIWIKILASLIMVAVGIFILSCPSDRPKSS